MKDLDYLQLLSQKYSNQEKVAIEIANLSAILTLPKGTEYFFSDLHGEYESFIHLLHSASGIIRTKITFLFNKEMNEQEILDLANIIYYPEEKLANIDFTKTETFEFQKEIIRKLVELVKSLSKKYTKSKTRKCISESYRYIIEELMYKEDDAHEIEKEKYYVEIINAIVENGLSKNFIIELCKITRRLAIDELHIVGDICDRGPRQDYIFDELINFNNVDIQWGNHDIDWMGAYVGNSANLLSCLRIAVRYNCFDMLEDGYGINLRLLNEFIEKYYKDDPCDCFATFTLDENIYDDVNQNIARKMQKALTIMQFKAEGKIIKRHPEYEMDNRIMLERINYDEGTVDIDGKIYKLKDTNFPTIDKNNPLELNDDEKKLLAQFKGSFMHGTKLSSHIKFLYDKGAMYNIKNGNLLYHGIIPFDENGELAKVKVLDGKEYSGKEYLDKIDHVVRKAYQDLKEGKVKTRNTDFMFYLWCGKYSPLYGKNKISTFESYFVEEKETHKEISNPYYKFAYDESGANKIIENFGLDINKSKIINGHVPVKVKDGETPIKAKGKLFVIDGGLSKGYRSKTGIAGYTLIYDSIHFALASHRPYVKGKMNTPIINEIETVADRLYVKDTDTGKLIIKKIDDLKELQMAFKKGLIKEKN